MLEQDAAVCIWVLCLLWPPQVIWAVAGNTWVMGKVKVALKHWVGNGEVPEALGGLLGTVDGQGLMHSLYGH